MNDLIPTCSVSFWRFAGAVVAGNVAALGAVYIARKALVGEHETTQKTAAAFTGLSAFWLVGGLTWVALSRKSA